jgi:transposase
LVKVPVRPEPPLLPENSTAYAEILLEAWRTSCKIVIRATPMILKRRGSVRNYKGLQKLLDSAEALCDHSLSPLVWAVWRAEQWREMPKASGYPSLLWTYDPSKVNKWRGWCRTEMAPRITATAVPVAQHRELVARWTCMYADLVRVPTGDVDAVKAVVKEHFPRNTFAILLEAAKADSGSAQRSMQARVRRGGWIWH